MPTVKELIVHMIKRAEGEWVEYVEYELLKNKDTPDHSEASDDGYLRRGRPN